MVCLVPGGQCTKSHCLSGRSSPSMISTPSPAMTRKSSWSASQWYMAIASPGWCTPMLTPSCSNSLEPSSMQIADRPSVCRQRASFALRTYQPSPGASPCSVCSRGASGTTAAACRSAPQGASRCLPSSPSGADRAGSGPRARRQLEGLVADSEPAPQRLAELGPCCAVRRRREGGCRSGAGLERYPEIVEILVGRADREDARPNLPEARRAPERRELALAGPLHHAGLVGCRRPVGLDLVRGIPERAQQCHPGGVVPHACGHDTVRARDADHLGQASVRVGEEVDDELRQRDIEGV